MAVSVNSRMSYCGRGPASFVGYSRVGTYILRAHRMRASVSINPEHERLHIVQFKTSAMYTSGGRCADFFSEGTL